MAEYFNSGLYLEQFYTKYELDLREDHVLVEYNKDLLMKEWNTNEDETNKLFLDKIEDRETYYRPLIFDEKIALKCNLIPFSYNEINMLSISGEFLHWLDAYQFLVHNSIDRYSLFFNDNEHFKKMVGEELTEKMVKATAGWWIPVWSKRLNDRKQ